MVEQKESLISKIGDINFEIRWGLIPMYLGLWVAMGFYVVKFFQELIHLGHTFMEINANEMLIAVLGLIDVMMIANLLVMVTVGGFSVFVKEYNTKTVDDKPRWLNNINTSTIKIKIGMSLIGVTAIHLLSVFMQVKDVDWNELGKLGFIFVLFIFFTYMLCIIDGKLHALHPSKSVHEE